MSVLEEKVGSIERDVTEIKADVKSLIASQAAFGQELAVRDARDARAKESRSAMGVWSRSMVPWVLTGIALFLTILNTVSK